MKPILEASARSYDREDVLALNYINTGWEKVRETIVDAVL